MNFATWEPVYEAILADFAYDRAADESARDLLADLVEPDLLLDLESRTLVGNTVAIAGGASSLSAEFDVVEAADVTVATATAAARLRDAGLGIDWLVTDLDGVPETAQELSHEGTPVVVHAHGDNAWALREYVPGFAGDALLPTTQAEPVDRVANVGGFTDGDRAAFLADALGADRLWFPGWEFDDERVGHEKRHKLVWAERLLYWLERRRGDRFDVLDGRRDGIDAGPLPIDG